MSLYKNILSYLFLIFLLKTAFSQNAFDKMLDMDTIYRNNTSLKSLDSLFSVIPKNTLDTSFSNQFGKAEIITLDQMIYFARFKNPDLASMQYRIDALRVDAESKTYLPDPMLEVETDDVASNFKKVGMINFYASQMFPFPGKLGLEKKSLLKNADMMEMEHHNMDAELISMIKMNYYDLFLLEQKAKINKDNQLLLNTFVAAAESKYSVGKGMQQEVFKSQIELSKLRNEENIIRLQKKSVFANLTKLTLTQIDENTRVNFSNIDFNYILDKQCFEFEKVDRNSLLEYAFQNRADLKAIQNKILMSQIDIEMARKSKLPDFTVKLGYKILPFEEHNAFDFMFGISVPIAPWSWGKYDFTIQKNEIMMQSTRQDYESKRIEIKNQIDTVLNALLSLKETMHYYNDVLIPQTENSLRSTQYSYENNMTSFLDLLDSYRMLLDSRNMFYESANMYLKMIADLEKITGMNFKN